MAVALKDLIDIELLDYYDQKVKSWVVDTLNEKTSGLELTTREELPAEGEPGRLYIVEDSILTWDEVTNTYVSILEGSGSSATVWEEL